MFGQKRLKRQEELKRLLSELYNGVSKPEYGDNYADFKAVLLTTYQKVDQGKWAGKQISDICDYIQHIALVNYKHNIETPSILSEVRPKLQQLIRRDRPILGLWIYQG